MLVAFHSQKKTFVKLFYEYMVNVYKPFVKITCVPVIPDI